ncbi:MAG: GNAT family N-acetyltransferase [Ferruginibacter sp.]
MNNLKIILYENRHQPDFERLNRQWIEALFTMEPLDEYVLKNPFEAILQKGGVILMAEYDGVIAGTVALRKLNSGEYEFTKMAVDENFRRKGIGDALCRSSLEVAKALGVEKVILYSNRKNKEAIMMYEKTGFKHIPVEKGVYERADVKMEIDVTAYINRYANEVNPYFEFQPA